MMKQTILIAFFVLMPMLATNAADRPTTKRVVLGGSISCADYTTYKSSAAFTSSITYWALGYLSGVNMTLGDDVPELLENVNGNTVREWISNYCTQHPLDATYDATNALVHELIERRAKRG